MHSDLSLIELLQMQVILGFCSTCNVIWVKSYPDTTFRVLLNEDLVYFASFLTDTFDLFFDINEERWIFFKIDLSSIEQVDQDDTV